MKLKKWALLAEISGAVAVVVSLVFVGYQVRQSNEQSALNTTALQLAAYQQLVDGISEFNVQTLENAELRAVRVKIEAGTQIEDLTPDEWQVINAFLYLIYRNGDLAYLQYRRGIIDEERLRSGMGILVNYLAMPTVRKHWDRAKQGFVADYSDYVDRLATEISEN